MDQGQSTVVALQIDGLERIVYAQPRPEDFERLRELLGGGPIAVQLDDTDDTEGHAALDDIVLDVEGHAFALRMPTAADAAALRKGFAMGAVTATLVIAGTAAAIQGGEMLANAGAAGQPAQVEQPAAAPGNQGIEGPLPPSIVRVE
ncbi:MAG TPA: hypothetical protein VMP67_09520 [Candidatus Limnocylindria bacterium]|nr:hypothetical protein [Candidatus Limnocylindria bacterium]